MSDIARFVHHQPVDRYDVLRSNPELLAVHQRILTAEFDLPSTGCSAEPTSPHCRLISR